MLNIPVEIQELIKTDGVKKNFRVHFPNGERADITNENIASESVSFTESVCSSDIFRFGGAEASEIQFEMVGIENIIGMMIECSMEYAVPANMQATYGEWYSVLYGTFTVTSCPRNHEDMTHRKVQAVSRTSITNDELMPQVEQGKLNIKHFAKDDYEPNVKYLLGSVNGITDEYTTTFIGNQDTISSQITGTQSRVIAKVANTMYYAIFNYKCKYVDVENCLYTLTGEYDDSVDRYLDSVIASLTNPTVYDTNIEFLKTLTCLNIGSQVPYNIYKGNLWFRDFKHLQHCYPYMNMEHYDNFWIPVEVTVEIRKNYTGGELVSTYTGNPFPTFSISKHTTVDDFPLTLAINHTLETSLDSGIKMYSFANAYTMADIVIGYAELFAGFNRRNRDGSSSVIRFNNTNPYPLTASDVEGQAWWDEYDIADIGSIKYCWTDGKGDNEGEYTWNPDGSVYDMTDNGLFKSIKLRIKTVNALDKMTDPTMYYVYSGNWYAYNGTEFVQMGEYESKSSIIEHMLDTFFLPYADIHFAPIDMNIRGLPFLQCGDAITFTAADGTVIQSYILNHTFSGIQHITENLDTVQGEVLA
ncbi:MAG: hypothetical protein K6F23_15035 [Solobacterium sp.]|nr:hypothetical protein [Solobacterium sp.]